jgi:hypothetical protein
MAKQKTSPKRSKRDAESTADRGTGQNGDANGTSYEQELLELLQERIKPGLNSGAIPLLARSIAKDIARRVPSPASEEEGDEEFIDESQDEFDEEATGEAEDDFDEATGEAEEDFDDESEDEDEEPTDEADEEFEDEAEEDFDGEAELDDETEAEGDDEVGDVIEPPEDFQADMQALQQELGEDWILRFSVQGDDAWMTAEKDDGSQRLEAPDTGVLVEAVELLNPNVGREEE